MPLDVELQERGQAATRARIRDISVRGFYFFSPVRYPVGATLTFSVPHNSKGVTKQGTLIRGLASIVRCEELRRSSETEFGIAAKIDEITP